MNASEQEAQGAQTEFPAWLDSGLFPFDSRFLDIDGSRIHYVDQGSGPVLLMLHGNPTWSFLYRGVIEGLQDRFRCVALDYPGFGLSAPAPGYAFTPEEHSQIVDRFITELDLDAVTLFIHDWGGPIGFAAAARRRERFRALVVANTFAWPVDDVRHMRWFSRIFGGLVGRLAITRLNAFVNLVVPAASRRRLSRAEMRHYRRPLGSPAARAGCAVLPRALLSSRGFLLEAAAGLQQLADLPALIVWGSGDPVFRPGVERRRFEQALAQHTVVELPRAKHYVQEDAPEEIAAAIVRWWGVDGP